MNRSSFAFFVALIIHILLLLLFLLLKTVEFEKKQEKPQEKKIKISLKEMPKKKKDLGEIKKPVPPSPIAPPMPKGSQLKKLVEKPPVKYEPKKTVKKPKPKPKPKLNPTPKPKVTKPKPKPQAKVKPIEQKPYIVLQDHNKTKKEPIKKKEKVDPLYAMLSQDRSKNEKEVVKQKKVSGSSINQNIKELYGDEFGKLTSGQQKYIIDNQEIMRRITQQILTRVARVNIKSNLNVNKSNVIEFYLHPNGDMTDFKFLKKSGYYILDDTTKETISYAYSRYPRPTEKTLVRYNVFYNLAY